MNEEQWLESHDPKAMLEFLRDSGTATDRKLRLFAVGCSGRVWQLLNDERSRNAVTLAGQFADGAATAEELRAAWEAAWDAVRAGEEAATRAENAHTVWAEVLAARAAACTADEEFPDLAAGFAAEAIVFPQFSLLDSNAAEEREQAMLCNLVRDIFGNPFRRQSPLVPAFKAWNDGLIPNLAEAAYENRSLPSGELDRGRLLVLADALEEAGAEGSMLVHLRGAGPFVRGDWVVDLLTGRA